MSPNCTPYDCFVRYQQQHPEHKGFGRLTGSKNKATRPADRVKRACGRPPDSKNMANLARQVSAPQLRLPKFEMTISMQRSQTDPLPHPLWPVAPPSPYYIFQRGINPYQNAMEAQNTLPASQPAQCSSHPPLTFRGQLPTNNG
ncbi:hypothetical protein MMC21_004254 [Puttea exsequens]|nr:hypothetical protein [Puttea exsequens]